MEEAFGAGCPEGSRRVKLNLPSRALAFSTNALEPEGEGIKVSPCSLVCYRIDNDGRRKILTTVRSDWAIMRIDRPVRSTTELANRIIRELELADGSRIVFEK